MYSLILQNTCELTYPTYYGPKGGTKKVLKLKGNHMATLNFGILSN